MTPRNEILVGDALDRLRGFATESVDCVVSSPPFYLLRNYGTDGQIGLEETVDEWVERLRVVMREVRRVLTPTGSVWLDLGDSYSRRPRSGAPAKSLLLAPERLALALVADGWILRSKVIWAKTNPMPSSVGDRLTNTYDVVFHLVKQARYHYDLASIRTPQRSDQRRSDNSAGLRRPDWAGPKAGSNSGLKRFRPPGVPLVGKNPGDVWFLPTAHYRGAHFATFPERLVERPILATCPLRVCTICSTPWRRQPGKTFVFGQRKGTDHDAKVDPRVRRYPSSWRVLHQPGPLEKGCKCDGSTRPGLVLDPFFGTGTVGAVAQRLGRDWIGIELNPDYAQLSWRRLRGSPRQKRAA
jgi:DNA modification methylase